MRQRTRKTTAQRENNPFPQVLKPRADLILTTSPEHPTSFSTHKGGNYQKTKWQRTPAEDALLDDLERRTLPARTIWAREAAAKERELRLAGEISRADQCRSEKDAHIQRFNRVRDCGSREVRMRCCGCGNVLVQLISCDEWKLCSRCELRRVLHFRTLFQAGREKQLEQLSPLVNHASPDLRCGEKFLTLTVPHSGDLSLDVKILPCAWQRFWTSLQDHFVRGRGMKPDGRRRLAYVRVIEATPGRRNDGHAHLHVYAIMPFVRIEYVRLLWSRALEKSGFTHSAPLQPLDELLSQPMPDRSRAELQRLLVTRRNGTPLAGVPRVCCDIRKCDEDVENRLITYMVKTRKLSGDRSSSAEFLAQLYIALRNVRTIQSSRGFWPKDAEDGFECANCDGRHRGG